MNFQEFTTISNACTKKSGNLLNACYSDPGHLSKIKGQRKVIKPLRVSKKKTNLKEILDVDPKSRKYIFKKGINLRGRCCIGLPSSPWTIKKWLCPSCKLAVRLTELILLCIRISYQINIPFPSIRLLFYSLLLHISNFLKRYQRWLQYKGRCIYFTRIWLPTSLSPHMNLQRCLLCKRRSTHSTHI